MSYALSRPPVSARPCSAAPPRPVLPRVVRRTADAAAPSPPALRALLVGPDERARHADALARELAPGLWELVARVGRGGALEVPARAELAADGAGTAALFHRARLGTCGERLEFCLAAPAPGVHAYMLGGPGQPDVAVAVLELESLLGQALGPAGTVVAVPSRGTALFLAPGARRLRRSLVAWGLRQFWCAEREAAPVRLGDSLRFLATWARDAHRGLPGPVAPGLYWHHHGRLSALGDLSVDRLPRELARLLVADG